MNDYFMRFEFDISQGCLDVIKGLNCDAVRMVIDQDIGTESRVSSTTI